MKLICYCHGYIEADIITDLKKNKGESSIMKLGKITLASVMKNILKSGDA